MAPVCSICLQLFDQAEGGDVVATCCGHVYHETCLRTWANGKVAACPKCKKLVPHQAWRKIHFCLEDEEVIIGNLLLTNQQLVGENSALKAQLAGNSDPRIAMLRSELDAKDARILTMESDFQQQLGILKSQIAIKDAKIEDLKNDNIMLIGRIEALNDQNIGLRSRYVGRQGAIKMWREGMVKLHKDLLEAKLATWIQEQKTLKVQKDNTGILKKLAQVVLQNGRLRVDNLDLLDDVKLLNKKVKNLQIGKKNAKKIIAKLQRKVTKFEQDLEEAQEVIEYKTRRESKLKKMRDFLCRINSINVEMENFEEEIDEEDQDSIPQVEEPEPEPEPKVAPKRKAAAKRMAPAVGGRRGAKRACKKSE